VLLLRAGANKVGFVTVPPVPERRAGLR